MNKGLGWTTTETVWTSEEPSKVEQENGEFNFLFETLHMCHVVRDIVLKVGVVDQLRRIVVHSVHTFGSKISTPTHCLGFSLSINP